MSEDLQCQRYYVLERIGELREQIPQAMQAMVVFRARIEKYRQTDLSTAHDTYDALRRVRDDLTQALADAQPLLMELESYALATMAGQLLRGFKGFDLMSTARYMMRSADSHSSSRRKTLSMRPPSGGL